MKRRILIVSAMILLLGSQMQMYAQKKGGLNHKRPAVVVVVDKPGKPMNRKAISQGEIKRLQDFYWKKYRVKLSKKEAERILIVDMKDRRDSAHKPPRPKGKMPSAHRPRGM